MTAKELYQQLGKIINQGYGDCDVTTNLESDYETENFLPSCEFINEADTYFCKNGKILVNLYF